MRGANDLPFNKCADFILAVREDLVDTFLAGLNEEAREYLDDNPEGETDGPVGGWELYPNATFHQEGYQFWIRRNVYPENNYFDQYNEAATDIFNELWKVEGAEKANEALNGTMVYQATGFGDTQSFGAGKIFDSLNLQITYVVTYGGDDCEYINNDVDYKKSPRNNDNYFACFLLSIEPSVAKLLDEIMPKEIKKYLDDKFFTHCIYHNEDDARNGCESFLFLNVPLKKDEESKKLIGDKFIKFFEKNKDKLAAMGRFAFCIAPQPGLVSWEHEFTNAFTTPWDIMLQISMENSEDVSYLYGDPLYYAFDPTYARMLRYIYVETPEQD